MTRPLPFLIFSPLTKVMNQSLSGIRRQTLKSFCLIASYPLLLIGFHVTFNFSECQAQLSFSDPRVKEGLRALESEPTIQEVHRAALRFYHAEPETIDSLRSRATWKHALPDINVRFRRSDNGVFIDKRSLLEGDISDNYLIGKDESEGDVTEFQVSGTWSLSRLLFNPEVLDVSSMAALQEGVLKEVTRLYYTRRRLQIDLILNPPRDPSTQLSKELRIEQITATLDALTQNLFSKSAAGSGRVSRGGDW